VCALAVQPRILWEKEAGLQEFDEIEGLAWQWQGLDGTQIKAPFASAAPGGCKSQNETGSSGLMILVDGEMLFEEGRELVRTSQARRAENKESQKPPG
jgi:hypothetical protein